MKSILLISLFRSYLIICLFRKIESVQNAFLSRFSTWRICSREQRKKQLDWLATNTDDITNQSHSLFACSREQIRQVENRLNKAITNEPTHIPLLSRCMLYACLCETSKASNQHLPKVIKRKKNIISYIKYSPMHRTRFTTINVLVLSRPQSLYTYPFRNI